MMSIYVCFLEQVFRGRNTHTEPRNLASGILSKTAETCEIFAFFALFCTAGNFLSSQYLPETEKLFLHDLSKEGFKGRLSGLGPIELLIDDKSSKKLAPSFGTLFG